MMILSRVCAQFRDARGNVIFTVDPSNWLNFVEAPEAIMEDPPAFSDASRGWVAGRFHYAGKTENAGE